MVNIEEFSNRLKKVMDFYNLSASSFAEKLEVQRSSISHLLSGRNKPSLDFVLKVLKAFPEIELYWLLNGTGVFPKEKISEHTSTPLIPFENTAQKKENKIEQKIEVKAPNEIKIDSEAKEIERIVIFYADGSFKNYTP